MHGNAKQTVLIEGHRAYHLAGDQQSDERSGTALSLPVKRLLGTVVIAEYRTSPKTLELVQNSKTL
jgi:hypothetical protein